MEEKLISVIMPVYNAEKYLKEAVKSVVNQTYKNWELIMVDDGSTDDSSTVMEQIQEQWGLNYNINSFFIENSGETFARTYGIGKSSKQDYFLPFDNDDLLHPEYMTKMAKFLEQHPKKSFAYCNTEYFGAAKKEFDQPEYNLVQLTQGNFISYCSLIKFKDFFESGGYDINNRGYWPDYNLWLRMGYHGKFGVHLRETLFYYRVHESSAMQTSYMKENGNAFMAYFIKTMPEIFHPSLQSQADEILKLHEKDFMSRKH